MNDVSEKTEGVYLILFEAPLLLQPLSVVRISSPRTVFMKFFQNHYWYLLVVGLLSYFVSYICFRRVVSLLLRWSSVGLCSQHGQPGTKEEQADVRQQSDRGDKSECENCIQKTGQLVAEVSEK